MSVATISIGARPLSMRGSTMTLLMLLLVTTTGWSVLAGGWTDSNATVLLVGIAGALEMLVLARAGTPRLVALLGAPFLLFASLLPTTLGSRPATGTGLSYLVAQYATAAATGLLGNAQWEFNVALAALLWICGAWAAWFAIRERRGALATGPCWAVLAVNVINAPAGNGVGLPATVGAVTAIMLIAAVYLERLNDGWRRRHVGVLPGTDSRFAAAAVAGGVIIVVLALVAPPLTSTDLSARLFGFGGHNRVPGGHGRSFAAGTVQFNTATIPGGALALSSQPVLTYRTNNSATTYLRMATDAVFAEGNWLPDSTGNNPDIAVVTSPPGPLARDRNVDDGGVGGARKSITAFLLVSADNPGSDVIPFPGEPDSASVVAHATGVSPPGAFGGLLSVDQASASSSLVGTSLTTTGMVSTATADQLRHAGNAYPDFLRQEGFVSLPDDGSGQTKVIQQLALQWTVNTTNPYDEATTIENHLRSPQFFHYTLNPPVPAQDGFPGDNVWPVVYFLTKSHAGYCQYFASAMGSMLRSLGIPARLVNGYGPGNAPEAAGHNNNVLNHTVTSNDAHSWVEAYFPKYGWIPFEPTPPSQLGDYEPFVRSGAVAPPSSSQTATPASTPTPSPTTSGKPRATPVAQLGDANGGPTAPAALTAGTLAALGALLVTVVAVTWFLRPRTIRGVWLRVALLGRVLGVRRDRSLTYDEYARRLAEAVPPDTTSLTHRGGGARRGATPLRRRISLALADIAAVSDRATYGAGPPHPRELVRMRRAWSRIARVALRIGWRAILSRSATP